ncbi:MAG: hypothetical protein WCE68_18240 [Anaerolineales bacterium]
MTAPAPTTSVTNRKAAPRTAPSPAILRQLGEVLTRQASLLIDMIIPGASHVYRPTVFLANAETASTNGSLWIRMPIDFLGLHYPTDRSTAAPIWLGLLAHEFGHWLQPLDEMIQTEKELHVPHFLVNVLLDIHGEALVAGLFPGLHGPLTAQRAHIGRAMYRKYQRGIHQADTFLTALSPLALYYRFCCGKHQWSYYPHDGPPASMSKLDAAVVGRVRDCALAMANIVDVPTRDLPLFLRDFVAAYPELALPPGEQSGGDGAGDGEGSGMEDGGSFTSSGGSRLIGIKKMLADGLPATLAGDAQRLGQASEERVGPAQGIQHPKPEALRLASTLTVRFQTPKGMLSVPAPGRLDRIAALHQDPMPFRLDLPSRFSSRPSPKVVLHVDRSGSMAGRKWEQALLAAQAIALAIRRAGGDVRVVIFTDDYYHTDDFSADALFASALAGNALQAGGGTSFTWLPAVWALFPEHVHILLTDGEGTLPVLIPTKDRRRTFAIVIPDGNPAQIAPLAAKVVVVHDLNRLPGVFAFLAPRQWVG